MTEIGQFVYSKNGRTRGGPYVVFSVLGEYVCIIDGKSFPISKPKKKKQKHMQATNFRSEEIHFKLINKAYINDAEIRKAIKNSGLAIIPRGESLVEE